MSLSGLSVSAGTENRDESKDGRQMASLIEQNGSEFDDEADTDGVDTVAMLSAALSSTEETKESLVDSHVLHEHSDAHEHPDSLEDSRGLLSNRPSRRTKQIDTSRRPGLSDPATRRWASTVVFACVCLMILGLLEFVAGFFQATHSIAGAVEYVSVGVGAFGLFAAAISLVPISTARNMSDDDDILQRAHSNALLSFFVHVGFILWVCMVIFSIGMLCVQHLFTAYVELHWSQHEAPEMSLSEAKSSVQFSLIALSMLSLVSCFVLALALLSATCLRTDAIIDGQTFLWSTFCLGMCGCLVLAISTYSSHHEATVPVSWDESVTCQVIGVCMFLGASASLYRVAVWKESRPQEVTALHSGGLLLCAIFLAAFSTALFYRGSEGEVDTFLHGDSVFSRFGMHSVDQERDFAQLRLTAQIQCVLLGLCVFVVTLFTMKAAILSIFLDTIMHADHIQRNALALAFSTPLQSPSEHSTSTMARASPESASASAATIHSTDSDSSVVKGPISGTTATRRSPVTMGLSGDGLPPDTK